ncbi:virulence protein [Salmonella bongori]|nr:virulence protein [Salmonella bongori]
MTSEMLKACQAHAKSSSMNSQKRVHQLFPDAQVKVKPMQANALNSDCTKTEKERLHRMLEEMFDEADMWLVAE